MEIGHNRKRNIWKPRPKTKKRNTKWSYIVEMHFRPTTDIFLLCPWTCRITGNVSCFFKQVLHRCIGHVLCQLSFLLIFRMVIGTFYGISCHWYVHAVRLMCNVWQILLRYLSSLASVLYIFRAQQHFFVLNVLFIALSQVSPGCFEVKCVSAEKLKCTFLSFLAVDFQWPEFSGHPWLIEKFWLKLKRDYRN